MHSHLLQLPRDAEALDLLAVLVTDFDDEQGDPVVPGVGILVTRTM
jgi:hypothetical protein